MRSGAPRSFVTPACCFGVWKQRELFLAFVDVWQEMDVQHVGPNPLKVRRMCARSRCCFAPVADPFYHIWTRSRHIIAAVGMCEPISQCLQPWCILNSIQRRISSEGPLGHNGATLLWNSLFPMAFVEAQWLERREKLEVCCQSSIFCSTLYINEYSILLRRHLGLHVWQVYDTHSFLENGFW